MLDYEHARHQMVDTQIARRGIRDERVLEAMRGVPREAFVDEGFEEYAYEDRALPIGGGQTLSQPYIVACMAEAARIETDDRVLEIGTGSGYAAAVYADLAAEVFTVERVRELAEKARERLQARCPNVVVRSGDGSKGWREKAPFDVIVVAAGGPAIPVSLQEQLEIGGRLIMPVGAERGEQRLMRIKRVAANKYEEEDLGGVVFVPLIGEEGWPEGKDARK